MVLKLLSQNVLQKQITEQILPKVNKASRFVQVSSSFFHGLIPLTLKQVTRHHHAFAGHDDEWDEYQQTHSFISVAIRHEELTARFDQTAEQGKKEKLVM